MRATVSARGRMEQATLASVGIHVLAALAIPALAWTASSGTPIETVSFTRILHVQVATPRPRRPPPRAAAPHHSPTTTTNFASRVHLVTASPRRRATHQRLETTAPAAPAVAAVQRAGEGSADTTSDAAPQATPSPVARAVASVGTHQTGGYLPFGAQQPDPVLDPGVLKQLGSLAVHVTLVVTVGDDGRTESIVFQPPIDPELESHIRSLLADASWDPAVCGGGVACEGHATIKL